MGKYKKAAIIAVSVFLLLLFSVLVFYFLGRPPRQAQITWGVDFSQMQSEALGLDWKENYLAILDDLGVKNIKLHTQWDFVEGEKDGLFFGDIDWQIEQAEKYGAKIIYVLGIKTGRWPECHIPAWAQNLSQKDLQTEALKYITEVVDRYKNKKSIIYWQVENEPFFKFGECPNWYYKNADFVKTEVALVRAQDPAREIIISDSGEQSAWLEAAKTGDIVGITLYRNAWAHLTDTFGFRVYSFLNPMVYYRKAQIVKQVSGKKVICIELQSEPWASKPLGASLEEQKQSMNPEMFRENIEFARETGLDTFYLWGAEWWYWMKETQNQPAIWNEAKSLFN